MEITINGAARSVPDEASLDQVVALVTSRPSGIAAAVNGELVRRASWAATRMAAGDEVEVLTAVQGG